MDGDLVYRCDQEGSVFSLTLPAHAPAPLGDAEPEDQNSLAGVAGN
jgi:hypothetical protein